MTRATRHKSPLHSRQSRRNGYLLLELTVAVVLVGALVLVVVQTLRVVAAERRFADQQRIAWNEAANLLERISATGPPDAEEMGRYRLSPWAREHLSDATVKVEAVPDDARLARVTVAIDWRRASGRAESRRAADDLGISIRFARGGDTMMPRISRQHLYRDAINDSLSSPSPLMGEGRGEGEGCALPRQAQRRGFTLIELLAAIALGSIVIGFATMLLTILMRGGTAQQRDFADDRRLARLGGQFRDDVHAAEVIVANDANSLVEFRHVDEQWTYRLQGSAIERVVSRAGATLARETYRLPDDCTASVAQTEGPTGNRNVIMVRLRIDSAKPAPGDPPHEVQCVEAWLGRDHRFTTAAPNSAQPARESLP